MKIDLITVGNIKNKGIQIIIDDYERRLKKHCQLNMINVKDVRNDVDKKRILDIEKQNILKVLDKSSYLIILDIEGKELDSIEFSKKIQNIINYENSKITFIIGGSVGIHEDIKNISNYSLSFSKMTFPHQLFRVIFLEQMYRCFKIIKNEPYHK